MMVGDGNSNQAEVELNLAPIIDCMVVLVTFMLISASFLSIGILETSVAAPGAADKQPDYSLELKILSNGNLNLEITGKKSLKRSIASADLEKSLEEIKATHPDLNTGVIVPNDEMPFEQVIQVLDKTKKFVPGVSLGGV